MGPENYCSWPVRRLDQGQFSLVQAILVFFVSVIYGYRADGPNLTRGPTKAPRLEKRPIVTSRWKGQTRLLRKAIFLADVDRQ